MTGETKGRLDRHPLSALVANTDTLSLCKVLPQAKRVLGTAPKTTVRTRNDDRPFLSMVAYFVIYVVVIYFTSYIRLLLSLMW